MQNDYSKIETFQIEHNLSNWSAFHLKVLASMIDELELTVYERDLLTYIVHKTLFFKKNWDALSQYHIANKRGMSMSTVKRTINALKAMSINLKGGKNGANEHNAYVTVYDMLNRGYRMTNLETLQTLHVSGQKFEIV